MCDLLIKLLSRNVPATVMKDTPAAQPIMRYIEPFIIKGAHNTVYPCTLPTWLPANIVDQMNDYFGNLLKQELRDLQRRSEVRRSRLRSTGSRGASVDSFDIALGENALILCV